MTSGRAGGGGKRRFGKNHCPIGQEYLRKGDIRELPVDGASKKAVEAVRSLLADIGIPKNLREAGAGKEGIEVMAQEAIQSKLQLNTPRKINLEDVKVLYEKAFA